MKPRNEMLKYGAGATLLALATAANAAIDVTAVVTAVADLAAPVGLIGAAVLLIIVAIKGFKMVRRAL